MMEYKLLCLCMILHLTTITSKKCGHIHLSVSAAKNSIVTNWRMDCPINQRKFVLTHKRKPIAWKNITSDKEKVSHTVTKVPWDYTKLPGKFYPNSTNPSKRATLCFPYYMRSYKGGKLDDKQCLMANVQWMSKIDSFADLRIGNMYIPGTHHSSSVGKRQHYDIWRQLVFGIRYFDFPISATRNQKGEVTFRAAYATNPLEELLKRIRAFTAMTYKEIVILDFRSFQGFNNQKDHKSLTKMITKYLGRWMANKSIWNHKYGPKLAELWQKNMRIIINYRYNPIVKKHELLWNEILTQNGKKTTLKDLRKHMDETLKNTDYIEKMRVYVAVLHPGKDSDEKILADRVNTKLSNWYNFDKNQKNINIIAVNFFEASKIHIDAVWINQNYH